MRITFPIVLLTCGLIGSAWAEQKSNGPNKSNGSDGAAMQSTRVTSLKNVIEPLSDVNQELEKLRGELKQAASDEARENIQMRIDSERERLHQLRKNFRDIIGGAEAAEYEGASNGDLDLEQQVRDLFQPVISSLREASSSPRELEMLRNTLDSWLERKRKAEVIIQRIHELETNNKNPTMLAEFESARKFWEGKKAECVGQIGVLRAQIDERESNRKPFWGALSDMLSEFFRNRGLNLLLALLAGVLGFLITRRIYSGLRHYSPVHRGEKNNLAGRISDILAMFLAVLVAVWGIVLVFYLRSDWLLLTLVLLFLIGAAWAGKQSLPPYIDQVRTMLNLGSIREGERLVHLGLPWQVTSISFFVRLRNPNLQGGDLRVPIRHLMDMVSREPDMKEPWFPSSVDDWIMVGDGIYGKVVTQTPEQVVILRLGGSLTTYPSADFLSQLPENLSHGFRVACTFGIDYQHQTVATTEVPEIFEKALTAALYGKFDREAIRSVKVEFASAGASSLDYQILVDVDRSMGSRYQSLQRLVQKVCVDTCNEHGWVIPFTQITVHQADNSTADTQS